MNGIVALRTPAKFIEEKCALYMRNGKLIHRPELINDDYFTIINTELQTKQRKIKGFEDFLSRTQVT